MALAFDKNNNAGLVNNNSSLVSRRPAFGTLMNGFLHRFAIAASFIFIAAIIAVL